MPLLSVGSFPEQRLIIYQAYSELHNNIFLTSKQLQLGRRDRPTHDYVLTLSLCQVSSTVFLVFKGTKALPNFKNDLVDCRCFSFVRWLVCTYFPFLLYIVFYLVFVFPLAIKL